MSFRFRDVPAVPGDSLHTTHRDVLLERIHLDNRFRLALSLASFGLAGLLHAFGVPIPVFTVGAIIFAHGVVYLSVWAFLERITALSLCRYVLSLVDFFAITLAAFISGSLNSPFFYLYPVPLLVHALQFDLALIRFDGALCLAAYGFFLWTSHQASGGAPVGSGAGQGVFLIVLVAAASATALHFRRKEHSVRRGVRVLATTAQFLEDLNRLPPDLSTEELKLEIVRRLQAVLKPLQVHSRLWIANASWNALSGVGEHAALRPGSPHHLPTSACPAFALRRAFRYTQTNGDPCRSEQFNYAKHLCLPMSTDDHCFGVLFLGSYEPPNWPAEDVHLFEMLAKSIALTLQRRALFENLQDKVSELNFSFEVGATALATFLGSTQSIDETTVHILDGVQSILKVDRASLMLWDSLSGVLQTQWVRGGDFTVQSPLRLRLGEGMAGWALQLGEPYWAEYAMGDPHYLPSARSIQSLLCVPVYTMDRTPLGVINAVTVKTPRSFVSREINFLKWFGRQAALAIENARLHHRSRTNIDHLSEINRAKSQFLSLVSHDLRGPLTGVRGLCEVLREQGPGPLNDRQLELLSQLQRQVDLQERMVEDLLDLARMEKGQLSIQPMPTNVATVIAEEVEHSQIEAKERGIILSSEIAALPSALVDGGRIRQVIWNLIHNALKFTPEAGTVKVTARSEAAGILIAVEDTGVGLSPETQQKVFERFFQVSPGGSKSSQGLGLGLAICREIVHAHGGTIEAHSPGLGRGTTMLIRLPHPTTDSISAPLVAA
jgi:signal transduction histidine kinase